MARQPRLDLPDIAQHIVQRGNNRLPCFLDDDDRLRYLHCLKHALLKSGCRLHAYVLMDNHVHLLATPPESGAVGRMMQCLGRRYVAWFNLRHGRTGTLWEGRYKACMVDDEHYALRCYRYIELNPVRAGMTGDPSTYRWSSCAANLGRRAHSDLTPHPAYRALGVTPPARARAYRDLLHTALPEKTVERIRAYLRQQRALGHAGFRSMVAAQTHRCADLRPAQRPRKRLLSAEK